LVLRCRRGSCSGMTRESIEHDGFIAVVRVSIPL
jgi:hypothetical protein